MIKPICRNLQILAQKARPATKQDIPLAKDLLETLAANSADCVGMAANMIGAPVAVIAVSLGPVHAESKTDDQKSALPDQGRLPQS